jgi:hypothetical protein
MIIDGHQHVLSDDSALFDRWTDQWKDLVEFEIVSIDQKLS